MSFLTPRWLPLLALAPAAALLGWWLTRRALAARTRWAPPTTWRRLGLSSARGGWRALLLALAVAGVVLALARPRWGEAMLEVERRGVDVVFVLDTSLSMAALDARPSRLAVAQAITRSLARRLPRHRFALLAAEGSGVVLTPLTTDAAAIELVLDGLEPGTLPTPGTSLAAALDQAIELYPEPGGGHRVAIVLSDGEDHEGGLDRAIEQLRAASVTVHAIGVGTAKGAPIPLPPDPARPLESADFKRDAQGSVVVTRRNDAALRRLAEATDGMFLTAENAGLDPAPLVARIGELEQRGFQKETIAALPERFQWPLALAAIALLGLLRRDQGGGASRRARSPRTRQGIKPRSTRSHSTAPARLALLLLASILSLSAAPPPWLERWLHNPFERTQRAMDHMMEGGTDDAIALFDAAQRLAPENPRAAFNAGVARLDVDPKAAERLLAAAASLADQSASAESTALAADAWFNLGNARLQLNDPASAAEAFRQALRRQPDRQGAKHNLELALRMLEGAERRSSPDPEEGSQQASQTGASPDPTDEAMQADGPADEQREGEGSSAAAEPEAPPEPSQEPGPEPSERAEAPAEEGSPPDTPIDEAPRFEPQPEMSAEQAHALLDAIERLERERRREEAARRRQGSGARARGKDW